MRRAGAAGRWPGDRLAAAAGARHKLAFPYRGWSPSAAPRAGLTGAGQLLMQSGGGDYGGTAAILSNLHQNGRYGKSPRVPRSTASRHSPPPVRPEGNRDAPAGRPHRPSRAPCPGGPSLTVSGLSMRESIEISVYFSCLREALRGPRGAVVLNYTGLRLLMLDESTDVRMLGACSSATSASADTSTSIWSRRSGRTAASSSESSAISDARKTSNATAISTGWSVRPPAWHSAR